MGMDGVRDDDAKRWVVPTIRWDGQMITTTRDDDENTEERDEAREVELKRGG